MRGRAIQTEMRLYVQFFEQPNGQATGRTVEQTLSVCATRGVLSFAACAVLSITGHED